MTLNRGYVPEPAPAHLVAAPKLLVSWTPWDQVFLDNLADLLLGPKRQPPFPTRVGEFWPDVFVAGGLPWANLARSALYHVFFLVVVWGFSVTWLQPPRVRTRSPFENSKLTYYNISEYLPEINTGTPEPAQERRGEPAPARQKIISLPPSPDNRHQTIITPSEIKLPQEAALPNLVAWTAIPARVPEAAMIHARLTAPAPAISPVAPPPDPMHASDRVRALPAPDIVQPAADPHGARSRIGLPNVPGPEIVGPPPSVDLGDAKLRAPAVPQPAVVGAAISGAAVRHVGALDIAHAQIDVAAPRLPVAEQRADRMLRRGGPRPGSGGSATPQASLPPPASVVAGAGSQDMGQLIALSVTPAPASGPIAVPAGSRHGEFAAGPEGKPGAPGTPDIRGADGHGGGGGNGGHSVSGPPPGISVSPGPTPVPTGAVVVGDPVHAVAAANPAPPLLASIRPMSVADLASATHPGASIPAPEPVDAGIFGAKKFYSMILNMPNMASAGGSWIIRFAELHETQGELTAPVATLKVDPAYPPEAIRDGVEGTVAIYAVIRRDGTVGGVRVLHGVDDTLNHNAMIAVSHWRFRPATKKGQAVDLEAVFHVPFVAQRRSF